MHVAVFTCLILLFVGTIFQIQKFRDELKNRSRVLKKLGHIDADGVVQLKGRAACLIDTGDELLVTELMFNGEYLTICSSILFPLYAESHLTCCQNFGQVHSMILIITKLQLLQVVLFQWTNQVSK